MNEINIKLYDIEKCGYYKNRSNDLEFCSLTEMLEQIDAWYQNKPLVRTSTFNPPADSNILKAYLVDIKNNSDDDYFFTVWNEVPTDDNNSVAALDGSKNIGKLKIKFSNFGDNFIPGFATYFWIIPNQNILATVRFNRSYNGHPNFKYLLQGFLANNPNYSNIHKEIEKGSVLISGYQTENDKLAYPRFTTSSRKKSGPIEYLKNSISNVTMMLGRPMVINGIDNDVSFYNNLLSYVGVKRKKQISEKKIKIEYKIPCSLDLQDFNEIYKKWLESEELSDVGFKIFGETIWLSHEIQKTEISANIRKINNEIYDLQSIMEIITPQKDSILNACSKDS